MILIKYDENKKLSFRWWLLQRNEAKMIATLFVIVGIFGFIRTDAAVELGCPIKDDIFMGFCTIYDLTLTNENYLDLKYVGEEDPMIVTRLFLNRPNVKKLSSKFLQLFPNLESIIIEKKVDLDGQIDDNFVNELSQLKAFEIIKSEISEISGGAFEKLTNLKRIALSYNKLNSIPENVFQENVKLDDVDLRSNLLTSLGLNTFKFNTKLTAVHLQHNQLQNIEENLFATLISLRGVNLAHNKFETLPANIFSNNLFLQYIDLKSNTIKKLSPETFKNQDSFFHIYLTNNVCIDRDLIHSLDGLETCYDNWNQK